MGKFEDMYKTEQAAAPARNAQRWRQERHELVDQLYETAAKFAAQLKLVTSADQLPIEGKLLQIAGEEHLVWVLYEEYNVTDYGSLGTGSMLVVTPDGWLELYERHEHIGSLRHCLEVYEASDKSGSTASHMTCLGTHCLSGGLKWLLEIKSYVWSKTTPR